MGTEAAANNYRERKTWENVRGQLEDIWIMEGEMKGKEGGGDQSSSRELAFSLPSFIPGRYAPKFPI
jgi:hypothetical protein